MCKGRRLLAYPEGDFRVKRTSFVPRPCARLGMLCPVPVLKFSFAKEKYIGLMF